MKIKICGIKRIVDTEILNELKPDYVGFVFAKSKRQINKELAQKIKMHLDSKIKTVGVFVNSSLSEIESYIEGNIIDCVQFHGNENEKDIAYIKNKFPEILVFKAVSVNSLDDILKWEDSKADFLLLDNGAGGTGKSFNWEILSELENLKKKYFIAGGLNPDNVRNIFKFKPFGVDVSGGVETDAVKDRVKIRRFIEEVRTDYE